MNCSEGPNDLLQSLKILKPLTQKLIVIQPNAGIPRSINGRYFYMTSPDYLAKFAKRYIEAGAFGVGGCCGTGPDHIRAIASSVKMLDAKGLSMNRSTVSRIEVSSIDQEKIKTRDLDERTRSKVGSSLRAGKKVISIEITSPRGTDLAKFMLALEQVKKAKVDFINVPDGARASTRVSSLHLASFISPI